MPTCALCRTAFFGRGNVTLPLGEPGDRCCDECNASKVIPTRLAVTAKRASEDIDDLDNHLHVSKRARADRENDDGKFLDYGATPEVGLAPVDLVPSETPVEACAPGIEFKQTSVPAGATFTEIALKPPLPATRSRRVVLDILVGLDDSISMSSASFCSHRGGGVGLRAILDDFETFLEHELKKLTLLDDPTLARERIDAVRATTNLKMFRFADCAHAFEDFEQRGGGDAPCFQKFEPLCAMKDIQEQCHAAAKQMTFRGQHTNFETAVQYAAEQFRERFEAEAAADVSADTIRVPCLVLLTDGSVSQGDNSAASILSRADAVVADVLNARPLSVFAIGLGEQTDPKFLSELCRGGFWAHAANPRTPINAFSITFGHILSALCDNSVEVDIGIVRDDAVPPRSASSITVKSFGFLTADSHRGQTCWVSIPPGSQAGDKLVVTTRFASDPSQTFESGIHVGKGVDQPRPYSYQLPRTTGFADALDASDFVDDAPRPTGTSVGLAHEVAEVDAAIERIKRDVLNGLESLSSTFDSLFKTCGGSEVVRHQIERSTRILAHTLTTSRTEYARNRPMFPSRPSASVPSYSSASTCTYSRPMTLTDEELGLSVQPAFSAWEVSSGFSQLGA